MGSSVRLGKLRSRPELNGTCGEVVEQHCDAHGQLLVKLFPEGARCSVGPSPSSVTWDLDQLILRMRFIEMSHV